MKKIKFGKRLIVLVLISLLLISGFVFELWYYNNRYSFSTEAASEYPYTVTKTAAVSTDLTKIREHVNIVYKALHERMPKYLGSPNFTTVKVLSEKEMADYYATWAPKEASSGWILNGEFYPPDHKISLNELIFQRDSSMNSSHVVIGHEMIHGFANRRNDLNRPNKVEEGITEYLADKHLMGPENAYPNEVEVTNELLNTFSRLGDKNPDDTLQKILFQDGMDVGLARLDKYVPSDAGTNSAFAYLNTMYNNKHYDKAIAWLQSIKGEEISKPGSPSPSAVGKTSSPVGTPASNLSPVPLDSSILGKIRFPHTNITSIPDLLTKLVYLFLPAAGAWAVIALIWSGIIYITAAGNTERQEKAKKNITWAITGIVIIALSGLMVYTFARILEGTEPIPVSSPTIYGSPSPTTPSGGQTTNPATPTPRMTPT